ncbi:MAG: dockerin type I repeat-containing protein [Clostridia bacterium]|nr:dockerin type I repeat-containing protein [Clostridia bacterium]
MKRIPERVLSLFLVFVMLATFAPLHFQADAAALIAGDVNFDGNVSADDARLALRASARLEQLSADQTKCADVIRDGKVSADDARLILRASARLETLEPITTEMQRATLTGDDLAPYRSDDYEILQLDSVTDGYGSHVILDDYVTITFDLPDGLSEQEKLSYAGVYFNDDNEPFYLLPDPDALTENKLSFRTLHFSIFGAVKPSEEKQIELWCDRAAAQDVSRRISEADITPQLTDMIGDALNNYGFGKNQYAGEVVRYLFSHDTKGEIFTAAVDGDMEALRSKVISGTGEFFLGKFLKGEGDDVVTQSFGDHEAAIRKSMKDKDYATAALEIVKNIEKNMFPAVNYTEKFAGLVDKLADVWADDMMNEQYVTYKRIMEKNGYVSDDDWAIIYTQLRGAANRLSSKGVGEKELRAKFEQRWTHGADISAKKDAMMKLVRTWQSDNLLDDIYWVRPGSQGKRPGVTDKLSSLLAIREMLVKEYLTVNGSFRKGKNYELSTNDEFIEEALFRWVTLGPDRRSEFMDWLREEGLLDTPPLTYPPEYAWVLVETRVEKNDNTDTGVYRTTYSASEKSHTIKNEYIWEEDNYQSATFTATCTAPPTVIRDGDTVKMHLSIKMGGNDKDFHWSGDAWVRRDRPDIGLGSRYVDSIYFDAAEKGEPGNCHVDAIGDWGNEPVRIPSADVSRTFGGPASERPLKMPDESYRIGIYFCGCGAQTVWVYEWQIVTED